MIKADESGAWVAAPGLQPQGILDCNEFDGQQVSNLTWQRHIAKAIAAMLAAVVACSCMVAPAGADDKKSAPGLPDDWSFSISPYAWGAGLKGSVSPIPQAPTVEVDESFSDIVDHVDIGGMLTAELRYQRFAAYMDLIYTSISADEETPFGLLFTDADLENDVFIGTFGGAYRAIDTEHASLDLLAGLRAWSVDTRFKLHGGLLPDQEFEHNENWVDPVIGLHGQYQFDSGIFIRALSQVGGFGVGSDLTWDVFGGLGYQFNDSISATAGYRHLEVDYENNGFVFDVELSGPVIGMTITF